MKTLHMKAFELYILTAFCLSWWAWQNPTHDYCFAAAGGSLALVVVGINEAIQRRWRRPDPLACNPPACYCGTCENCQNILRLEDVTVRTSRVDFEFPER